MPSTSLPPQKNHFDDANALMQLASDQGLAWRVVQRISSQLNLLVPHGEPGKCWEWAGTRNAGEYGVIDFCVDYKRGSITAHRAMLACTGKIPFFGRAIIARHSCDNPPCCNPEHLLPGTQKQNLDDMRARGRALEQRGLKPRKASRVYKLTDDQVREIRKLGDARLAGADISYSAVAVRYGIGATTAYEIMTRRKKTLVSD